MISIADLAWHLPMTISDSYTNQSSVLSLSCIDPQCFCLGTRVWPILAKVPFEGKHLLEMAVRKEAYGIAAYLVEEGVAPDENATRYLEENKVV